MAPAPQAPVPCPALRFPLTCLTCGTKHCPPVSPFHRWEPRGLRGWQHPLAGEGARRPPLWVPCGGGGQACHSQGFTCCRVLGPAGVVGRMGAQAAKSCQSIVVSAGDSETVVRSLGRDGHSQAGTGKGEVQRGSTSSRGMAEGCRTGELGGGPGGGHSRGHGYWGHGWGGHSSGHGRAVMARGCRAGEHSGGTRGTRWKARGVGQGSPPRTDSPRAGAAGVGGATLRHGRGGGARGLRAVGGVLAALPPCRATFLARRAGRPWTLLGQMLPKARRRPPCSMLPPRHRYRHLSRPQPWLRLRRAPSAPRRARRRPAGWGAGGRSHAGGCPPAFSPPGPRNLPPPSRAAPAAPAPAEPFPAPAELGRAKGKPEGNPEERRCQPRR